jgi:hypothetical protein
MVETRLSCPDFRPQRLLKNSHCANKVYEKRIPSLLANLKDIMMMGCVATVVVIEMTTSESPSAHVSTATSPFVQLGITLCGFVE